MVLKIAFDWSPNVLHSGLFVAKREGFYDKDPDTRCEFLIPTSGHVQHTAPRLLELNEVQLGIMSPDDVVFYHTQTNKPKLVALASLIQHRDDSTALCVWSDRIKKPADLDGKVYAAWGGHYETDFLRTMATKDGGKGDFRVVRPNGPEAWNTFLRKEADAVWIYTNCEGVEAELAGKQNQTRLFHPRDFQIPLLNSPVLVCRQDYFETHSSQVRKFLLATGQGYQKAAVMEPTRFAEMFSSVAGVPTPKHVLAEQFNRTKPLFLDANQQWGFLDAKAWERLVNFMDKEAHLLRDEKGNQIPAGRIGSGIILQGAMIA